MDEMFRLILDNSSGDKSSFSSWEEEDDFTGTKGKKLNDSIWEPDSDVKDIDDSEYEDYLYRNNNSSSGSISTHEYTSGNDFDYE